MRNSFLSRVWPGLFPTFLLGLVFWLALPRANAGEEVEIIGPDERTVIVIADGWKAHDWSDVGAHVILSAFLKEISGNAVPVLTESLFEKEGKSRKYTRIIYANRQKSVEEKMGGELDALDDDGFIIRAEGNVLYVAGKQWRGSIYAAYELLERYAGCRWYGPLEVAVGQSRWQAGERTGLFDIIPKAPSVRVPAGINLVEEPSYRSRGIRLVPLHSFRHRQRDQFHHNMQKVIDSDKYAASYPEVFPVINGERITKKGAYQPVISNPKTFELTMDYIRQFFRKNPDAGMVSLGMDDNANFSEEDSKLAPPSIQEPKGRIAWGVFNFLNKVADQVEKEFPGKRIGCLAYATLTLLPADTIRLRDNVVPYLTLDSAQLFDPGQVLEFSEAVEKWSKLATHMGVYEYMYGGGFLIPRIYNRFLVKNIQERYRVGVDGFYGEVYPNWGLDGPKYWLAAKMLWNNKQNPEALLTQYYGDLFGPAADQMRNYFNYLEGVWCTQNIESLKSNYRWFLDPRQFEVFSPEQCEHAWTLIGQAEAEARSGGADEKVLRRIAFFKETFRLTRSLCARYAGATRATEAWKASEAEPLATRIKKALPLFGPWVAAEDPRAALHRVVELNSLPHLDIFSGGEKGEAAYWKAISLFEKSPVQMLTEMAELITLEAHPEQTAVSGESAIARLLEWMDQNLGDSAENAPLGLLRKLVANDSTLFLAQISQPPVIDGAISGEEWPAPVRTGPLFEMNSLDPSVNPTTVWAGVHEGILYLAGDFVQPAETIGGKVLTDETGGWRESGMAKEDDLIVVCFRRAGEGTRQTVRINVNNASGGFKENELCPGLLQSATRRSDKGWQVELAFEIKGSALQDALDGKGGVFMPVVRYERVKSTVNKQNVFSSRCSSYLPLSRSGTVIGSGNMVPMMTFVNGPRVIIQD